MKYFSLIFVFLLKAFFICCQQRLDLDLVREWKQLDFDFPSSLVREDAIRKGNFIQQNAVPIDVDIDYQGKWKIKNHSTSHCDFTFH